MDPREEKLRELARLCGELGPDDGRDPRLERRAGSRKKSLHKVRQLCAEARRTIEVALAGSADETLRALVVRSVEPAPDASHLLVVVSLDADAASAENAASASLRKASGRLREELAAAIVRRRAPELTFRFLPPGGGVA